VVVVGAINEDLVAVAPRLPGPGETVVGPGVERHGGGKGANAAVAAARAGGAVELVGAVGADAAGATALDELRAEGIGLTGVVTLDHVPTGMALIVVDPDGENQIAVGAGANSALTADHVRAALSDLLPGAGCVLVSTEISGEAVAAAVQGAAKAGVRCVLNPAPVVPQVLELLAQGPVLTPNATEIEELATMLDGAPVTGASGLDLSAVSEAARRIITLTGAPVVVTLGGDGALALAPDGWAEHLRPPATTVRDTTGAGDTFNGVLATRLASGDGLAVAVRTAMVAASLSVTRVGARTGMPQAAETDAALRQA
jgi:ribokinase